MSDLIAVVPVKSLALAKSRLAPVLAPAERRDLISAMIRSVLTALAGSPAVAERIVVSPDPAALELARAAGARPLWQTDEGLNEALDLARAALPRASTMLALPADLPLLEAREVTELARASRDVAVVVAPDTSRDGTNALVLAPGVPISFAFGARSFWRHLDAATSAGLSTRVVSLPGLAVDLDTPADLAAVWRAGWRWSTDPPSLAVAMDSLP